jgi:hypothetical protein
MSKLCPQCKAENREQARFCIVCSAPLRQDTTPVRYCPSGRHPMDPGWQSCPYCNQESAAVKAGAAVAAPKPGTAGGRRRVTLAEGGREARQPTVRESDSGTTPLPAASVRRPTVFSSAPAPEHPGIEAGTRRVVAILVTYTWKAEGELFAVREGRNYLGTGNDCEIQLTRDPQLSSRHATILYRGEGFWIDDEKSMNGTSVNGQIVEAKRRLPNYAAIKTGATSWRFVVLEPPAAEDQSGDD